MKQLDLWNSPNNNCLHWQTKNYSDLLNNLICSLFLWIKISSDWKSTNHLVNLITFVQCTFSFHAANPFTCLPNSLLGHLHTQSALDDSVWELEVLDWFLRHKRISMWQKASMWITLQNVFNTSDIFALNKIFTVQLAASSLKALNFVTQVLYLMND